jgi:hypothetical protein
MPAMRSSGTSSASDCFFAVEGAFFAVVARFDGALFLDVGLRSSASVTSSSCGFAFHLPAPPHSSRPAQAGLFKLCG